MKPQTERPPRPPQYEPPYRRRDFDPIGMLTLVGVVAVLMISYSNMRDIDRLDIGLGQRLSKLENDIAQGGGGRPAAVAQGGLDPNRVYTVKVTSDAPIRGSANAPITIAEFSDFQ